MGESERKGEKRYKMGEEGEIKKEMMRRNQERRQSEKEKKHCAGKRWEQVREGKNR